MLNRSPAERTSTVPTGVLFIDFKCPFLFSYTNGFETEFLIVSSEYISTMPRINHKHKDDEDEPPKKKGSDSSIKSANFQRGELITDISGETWELGKAIGVGGFGEIYEASRSIAGKVLDNSYVAKVEKHSSGPLFAEINCYLRIGKLENIEEWKEAKKMSNLGMPHYIGSGSCFHNKEKYRFLLLPKYETNLEQILKEKRIFNIKTVSNVCLQILDILEYIHSHGYIHSDIKASNITLATTRTSHPVKDREKTTATRRYPKRQLKPVRRKPARDLRRNNVVDYSENTSLDEMLLEHELNMERHRAAATNDRTLDRVYLIDFGLASKYSLSTGEHKEPDNRKAHAGTVLFCSRDAHKGVPSRRSDLECLAYNMVYWLTGSLPWIEDLEQVDEVERKKMKCFRYLKDFLSLCFGSNYPRFVLDYFQYMDKLQLEEEPDYEHCRYIFSKAKKDYGYKNDCNLDFDNVEGWGNPPKKVKCYKSKAPACDGFLKSSPLQTLDSNIVFKRPKLRKNIKVQNVVMSWSKILTDPENIIKQGRERKITDDNDDNFSCLTSEDVEAMNPTYAMLDIYYRCIEKNDSYVQRTESNPAQHVEGYTQAMMSVYLKMREKNKSTNNKRNSRKVNNKRTPIKKKGSNKKVQNEVQGKKSKMLTLRSYSLRG
ncbi:unnamed protein product [Phyllotreta striolata]|uniref:non-specific serine/threonine protein kinase n=1 Tax=Phyllotreta striolata TaxID=444603 RepID=A0A9N9XTP4_PHYSR|nr:unnamed protein product [Phyllotreta striolata]